MLTRLVTSCSISIERNDHVEDRLRGPARTHRPRGLVHEERQDPRSGRTSGGRGASTGRCGGGVPGASTSSCSVTTSTSTPQGVVQRFRPVMSRIVRDLAAMGRIFRSCSSSTEDLRFAYSWCDYRGLESLEAVPG